MDNTVRADSTEGAIKAYLPKNTVFYDLVNFFGVFSDLTRIKLLSCLSISEMCVTDLTRILNLNQTTVSHQLKILRDAGFVGYRRDGKLLYYRIVNKYINDVMFIGASYLDSTR